MTRGGEQKQQTPILICRTQVPMTLTSPLIDLKPDWEKMRIRRRIEKLERSNPPTIAGLVSRIEREAMSRLLREEQKFVGTPGGAHSAAADKLYREAFSSSLKQVSDDDLERMILFCEPTTSHARPLR